MKSKEARELVESCRNDNLSLFMDIEALTDLVVWAYDKGWTEALEDLIDEEENKLLSKLKNPLLKNKLLVKECIRRFPKEHQLLSGEKND